MRQDTTSSNEGQLILAIKEEQIVVAPEGRTDIHIGVINQGFQEEYVNILVSGVPAEWTAIDTPVVHLMAGEAKQLVLTVQPPALLQSRVGQYPLDVRAVSQTNPAHFAVARSVLTVAAYDSGGRIGVALGSIHFSVSPGSSVTIPIFLQNHGLREDLFQLNVEGIPAGWISTNAGLTKLEPSLSKEIDLTIRVPRSAEAGVGRIPFKIIVISQVFPDQKTEVECILTVAVFSKFSAALQPRLIQDGQVGRLLIYNEGNTVETYTLSFLNPTEVLAFQKGVEVSRNGTQPVPQQIELVYADIPQEERVQVEPGNQGTYFFRPRLRSRPFIGNEKTYPFSVRVLSATNQAMELPGEVNGKGIIPPWLAVLAITGALALCLLLLIPFNNMREAAIATQTAAYQQTQVMLPGSGQADTDGDGLINSDEIKLGTDPLKPDSDGDGLLDGQEVHTTLTNPLDPDTDKDGLSDGQEVINFKTDPHNQDTDADLIKDGDEIARRTNPTNADTDQDGLGDGIELTLGTDPLQADTDKDGLIDGQENQNCPRPLSPDSDNDGILDGSDLDPCNANNPALTATALAGVPTQATPILPTAIPTATPIILPTNTPVVFPTNTPPIPTNTPVIFPTNTTVASPTATAVFPVLQGVMVFGSNRDGNPEIYAMNLANQSILRVTNNTATDVQPALAPDSVRVAYVSNQNGNNEIYLTGLDLRPSINLTNNAADDQQPAWSPDGNWIVFTSNRDGNQEIYVMRSDGSELRNLSSNGASDFAPTWFTVPRFLGIGSEDWIAFTSTRDGNQEIYRIRPDGTGLTNMTRNQANDYAPSGFADGRLVAFVTDRDGNPEIYTMTSDGGSPTNITNNFAQDMDPAFSPKGDWIAFTSDRDGNQEIYVYSMADGKIYNMTRSPAQDQTPDW